MPGINRIPLLPVLLVLTAGCQAPPDAGGPIATRTTSEVEADLDAMTSAWVAMANADDAAGVAALYLDDALYVDPAGEVYDGRDQIQAYLEETFSQASGLESERLGHMSDGDLVVHHGRYSTQVMDEASTEGVVTNTGRWVIVSEYQPDGSLRIRLHQNTWTN